MEDRKSYRLSKIQRLIFGVIYLKCKGIVIGERLCNNNGKFIDFLTDEFGIIEVYQRGTQSIKNENRNSLQMFAYSNLCFGLNKDKIHYNVQSAELLEDFYGIRNDIVYFALASYMAQTIKYTLDKHSTESKEVLRLLLNTLYYISNGTRNVEQLKSIFELRLLSLLGLAPNLLVCGRCELSLEDHAIYFSIPQNSAVCSKCANMNDFKLSNGTFKSLRHIVYSDLNRLFNFKVDGQSLKELSTITERLLLYSLNRTFSTLKYYKSVSNIK